jgi:tetratricopeptide (TPR) repeat protein
MRNRTPGRRGNPAVRWKAAREAVLRFACAGMAGLVLLPFCETRASFAQAMPRPGEEGSAGAPGAAKLREAASRYQQLVRENPDSAALWSNLGTVRAMSGDCDKALAALERARTLNSKLFTPWLFSGYCHLALHRDQQALQELEEAVRLNPRDFNAWYLKSQAAGDVGKLDESFAAAVRALALDPGNPGSYFLAGSNGIDLAARAYDQVEAAHGPANLYSLLLEGQRNAAQKVWTLAIDRYQKAQKAGPGDPEIDFSLGTVYLEKGEYPEAEAALRRCVAKAPGSRWARLRLALALAQESKRAEAVRLLQGVGVSGLELPSEFEDFVGAAYLLGLDQEAQAGLELAGKRFRYYKWPSWFGDLESNAAKQAPAGRRTIQLQDLTGVGLSIRFFLTVGRLPGNYVEQEFPSRAEYQHFQAAFLAGDWVSAAGQTLPLLRIAKPDARSAFVLGEVLQSLSYGLYERLAGEFPDSQPAMELAARNFEAMGEQAKALEIYKAALQNGGPSPDALRGIARIYWTQHDWDRALKSLHSLAAMDPNDPTIFVNMGRIYSFEQNLPSAEESFRRAAKLDPAMFEARLGLGQVLRREGDVGSALKELEAAARLDPKYPRTHYEISQIYKKMGKKDRAAAEMAEFQRLQTVAGAAATEKTRLLVPLD